MTIPFSPDRFGIRPNDTLQPINFSDPMAIADAATSYQATLAARGRQISSAEAVLHLVREEEKRKRLMAAGIFYAERPENQGVGGERIDFNDPVAIADAIVDHQAMMAAHGVQVSSVDALKHLFKEREKRRTGVGYHDFNNWPAQSRDECGKWTAGCQVTAMTPASEEDVRAKKERFVEAHLDDAQKGADRLGVPVENILGLSAVESGWGKESCFAREGNNYFSLHHPAPFATGSMKALEGTVRVSTFKSYSDCLESFITRFGGRVDNKADLKEFAKILQDVTVHPPCFAYAAAGTG